MRVTQIGNGEPPYSTENDLWREMEAMHVEVTFIQEQDTGRWAGLLECLRHSERPDLILWTRTKSLSDQVPDTLKRSVQIHAALAGVPMIGLHLDRWWGLARETDLYNDPFFRCSTLYTADGHHDAYWEAAGVNHVWSPPAIGSHNCIVGTPRPEFASDIAFVGAWHGYGHSEWSHRFELVEFLRKTYRRRVRFWPRKGQPAIRGQDLADLYASVKIVIGDSCLVPGADGRPMSRYCSDRVYETIGRGGFLLHPGVSRITDSHEPFPTVPHPWLIPGRHLDTWPLGDWDVLGSKIDLWLGADAERRGIARYGREYVMKLHTYRNRLEKVFRRECPDAWSDQRAGTVGAEA